MLLRKYEDFLNRVNELGYMTFSNILPGFPSLVEETPKEIWHTGNPDTDPWCWKDRAAGEKKLAFGCILGGHKGFVSGRMYSMFYTAFHPEEHMEERMESGEICQTVWRLWQLFTGSIDGHKASLTDRQGYMGEQQILHASNHENVLLNTSDIRQKMGVTRNKGASKVDSAIVELQQYYYITVAGSRRKIDKYGQPYGWPANVYDLTENWVPGEWMKLNSDLSIWGARESILDTGITISKNVRRSELAKTFGIK